MATSRQKLVNKVREVKKAATKGNVTYRLNKSLAANFKAHCRKDGLSTADVLEELIKDYIAQPAVGTERNGQ